MPVPVATPRRTSTLPKKPSAIRWIRAPERSYTSSAPPLSLPITTDWAGSVGCTQIAGSSAASPVLSTGAVSTVAVASPTG